MQKAVIFDFDDTLVVTTERFDAVRSSFCRLMEELGLALPDLAGLVDRLDVENVKRAGYFAASCFPDALCQAYRHCCREKGRTPQEEHLRQLAEMGWAVYREPPALLDDAHQLLETLQRHYPLVLLTKGEQDLQRRRIEESGLEPYFAETFIVGDKNDRLFKQLVKTLNLRPGDSWSVGNSIRSDINPALAAGMQAVHYAAGATWQYEHAEPAGFHYRASTLREVGEIILRPARNQTADGCAWAKTVSAGP